MYTVQCTGQLTAHNIAYVCKPEKLFLSSDKIFYRSLLIINFRNFTYWHEIVHAWDACLFLITKIHFVMNFRWKKVSNKTDCKKFNINRAKTRINNGHLVQLTWLPFLIENNHPQWREYWDTTWAKNFVVSTQKDILRKRSTPHYHSGLDSSNEIANVFYWEKCLFQQHFPNYWFYSSRDNTRTHTHIRTPSHTCFK